MSAAHARIRGSTDDFSMVLSPSFYFSVPFRLGCYTPGLGEYTTSRVFPWNAWNPEHREEEGGKSRLKAPRYKEPVRRAVIEVVGQRVSTDERNTTEICIVRKRTFLSIPDRRLFYPSNSSNFWLSRTRAFLFSFFFLYFRCARDTKIRFR